MCCCTLSGGLGRAGWAAEMEATGDPFVSRLRVPLDVLEGVALVDTPGTNAIIRQHQALSEGFLPRADLVLFLTSADRPFTESERQFLELVRRWGRAVIMVVNKADLLETPEAREQVRQLRRDRSAGHPGPDPAGVSGLGAGRAARR